MQRNQLSDDAKAVLLSIALGAIATIREDEEPKSFRERKMRGLEDAICDVTDQYRLHVWPDDKQAAAGQICDYVNNKLKKLFPKAKVSR